MSYSSSKDFLQRFFNKENTAVYDFYEEEAEQFCEV